MRTPSSAPCLLRFEVRYAFAGKGILLQMEVDRWEELHSLTGIPIRLPLIFRTAPMCFIQWRINRLYPNNILCRKRARHEAAPERYLKTKEIGQHGTTPGGS